MRDEFEFAPFEPGDVDGIIRLTSAEGWPGLASDRAFAVRVLSTPGAVTVVARHEGEVVGFGRVLTDGEWIASLVDFVVDARHRRRGIGRRLVEELFARSHAQRMDLLSEPDAEAFYRSLPHRTFPGYRVYPAAPE